MNRQKKVVFFDFAGTLMDHESDMKAHEEMVKAFCARYRIEEPVEVLMDPLHSFIRFFNVYTPNSKIIERRVKIRASFEEYMGRYGLRPTEEDLHWFRQLYLEKHSECIHLYPEAQTVLRALWETGLHVGLISDIDNEFIIHELTRLGIIEYFDAITTSEEAGVSKPDPHVFEIALSKANCTGSEAIHIGDNLERDIRGAKSSGMTAIWFPNDSNDSSDEPDYTIHNLNEVLGIVRDFGIALD